MSGGFQNEPMLEIFIYESSQLIEQLEQILIDCEKSGFYHESALDEIFRAMHTMKGSASMMMFNSLANLGHNVEDLFFFIREEEPEELESEQLTDLLLECIDFMKIELENIKKGKADESNPEELIVLIQEQLAEFKKTTLSFKQEKEETISVDSKKSPQKFHIGYSREEKAELEKLKSYQAHIFFEPGCEMENIRAFNIVHKLNDFARDIYHLPENLIEDEGAVEIICEEGFRIYFYSELNPEEVEANILKTAFLKELNLLLIDNLEQTQVLESHVKADIKMPEKLKSAQNQEIQISSLTQSMISVGVDKLDILMNLVGELVVSESIVSQNPDLDNLVLGNFKKATRQHKKIIQEVQNIAMSLRLLPISATFQKMNRIVRDMSKNLGKEVQLIISGEETEVDKNIIEVISDPLMHIIRNAIDHGIESQAERISAGKDKKGKIWLEAGNSGGDAYILIRDDGKGLDREKILKKARSNNLLSKADEEYSDQEVYSLILLPGFSTKERVTEYSGRGVGMDVVKSNIDKLGGKILIDSKIGQGSNFTIKIPLTLAIIDGMTVKVGENRYIIPTITIRESFKALEKDIIIDPDGNEMIMVRGDCYPILRIHEIYEVEKAGKEISEGMLVMVEGGNKAYCLFVDKLLGQQQTVVKTLPRYIKRVDGVAGCTLMGDGGISLILDVDSLTSIPIKQAKERSDSNGRSSIGK